MQDMDACRHIQPKKTWDQSTDLILNLGWKVFFLGGKKYFFGRQTQYFVGESQHFGAKTQ